MCDLALSLKIVCVYVCVSVGKLAPKHMHMFIEKHMHMFIEKCHGGGRAGLFVSLLVQRLLHSKEPERTSFFDVSTSPHCFLPSGKFNSLTFPCFLFHLPTFPQSLPTFIYLYSICLSSSAVFILLQSLDLNIHTWGYDKG